MSLLSPLTFERELCTIGGGGGSGDDNCKPDANDVTVVVLTLEGGRRRAIGETGFFSL